MTDVCIISGNAYTAQEMPGLDQASCLSSSGVWQAWPTDLEALFNTYFAFDPSLFELLIGYSILAFITGLATGLIVRLMTKTTDQGESP